MHRLKPHFEDVQAHYDLSDEFFRLFLDPSQTYSCAYFEKDDYTLEQAQLAKIDLALGKLGLQPGMTLLDVGCGWGSTMRRAVEKYDVNVIGLTLSKNQATYVQQKFDEMDSPRVKRVLLEGWEQFNEPVDRIVSIGAFEHFGDDRYQDFFKMAYEAMPEDGVMLLETITGLDIAQAREQGIRLTFALARFTKFIMTEIFPGGRLPSIPMVEERATERGFSIERVQHLQSHYAQTLDIWSAALEAHKDEAIDIQSEEVYERYMKYLTGCATLFREGLLDACQFTFAKGIYVAPDEVEEVVEKSRRAKDSNRFGQDLVAHGQSRTGVYSVKLKRDTTTRVTLPQVANQPFEVVLSEAPSTGYEWELQNSASVAKFIEDTYDEEDSVEEDTIGGTVTRRFQFQLANELAGEGISEKHELAFKLMRPWQPDDPPIATSRVLIRIVPSGGNG